MGSWNHTCAVSNLHVRAGQDVMVFLLVKNYNIGDGSFCYTNALYNLVPLPFYGKYDDYGGVEDCYGFGLPIILEKLKAKLYRFGQGPNHLHDIEVNAENLTIERLFEADSRNRLGIEDPSIWDSNEYKRQELERLHNESGLTESQQFELDRLANKIKKRDTFREITHVVIHSDIAQAIMEKWYIENYVGDGKGNTGYGNNYIHIYFKDLVESIPEYIQKKKNAKAELEAELEVVKHDPARRDRLYRILSRNYRGEYNSENLADHWLSHFSSGGNRFWELVEIDECVEEYIETDNWEGLANFVKEVLTAAWFNSFMSHTRKLWVKQSGGGSQSAEPLGYQVLAKATLDILEAEKREFGEDETIDPNQLELDLEEEI